MATKKAGKEVENTTCYTYKVEMLIQILAKDEPTALDQLEKSGGYVTDRQVTLMDSVSLFNGEKQIMAESLIVGGVVLCGIMLVVTLIMDIMM